MVCLECLLENLVVMQGKLVQVGISSRRLNLEAATRPYSAMHVIIVIQWIVGQTHALSVEGGSMWPMSAVTSSTPTQANKGKGVGTSKPNTRVFIMGAEEARRMDDVITGMFPVNQTYAHELFDYGANNSFVSTKFVLFEWVVRDIS
jgi:hypothetical protein